MNCPDTTLALLCAEAAVQRLIARYASCTDWLDRAGMAALFTPDADIDFGGMFRGGRDAFLSFVAALEGGYDRRMHMFGLPRIDIDGDTARAECAALTHVRNFGDERHSDGQFVGRYIFAAARAGDGWKLTRLKFYLNAAETANPPAGPEAPINLADGFAMSHADAPRG